MSFTPVLPVTGYAGWKFLQRTMSTQKAAFAASGQVRRDAEHARSVMAGATDVDKLMADRRLLSVSLEAYGLGDDINNRYFIRKVLSDGTLDTTDLANRLSDSRYREMARDFGFGDYAVPRTQLSDFGNKIADRYISNGFETAVGEVDPNLRLALQASRELPDIAASGGTENSLWYKVLGSRPLRAVFQTAFGLPESFAGLALDRQVSTLRDRTARAFGDGGIAQFDDPDRTEALIRRFLLRADASDPAGSSPYSAALAILRQG